MEQCGGAAGESPDWLPCTRPWFELLATIVKHFRSASCFVSKILRVTEKSFVCDEVDDRKRSERRGRDPAHHPPPRLSTSTDMITLEKIGPSIRRALVDSCGGEQHMLYVQLPNITVVSYG